MLIYKLDEGERERVCGDIYNNQESQAIFSWQATCINPLYNACLGVKLMKIPLIVIHRTCLFNVQTLTILKESLDPWYWPINVTIFYNLLILFKISIRIACFKDQYFAISMIYFETSMLTLIFILCKHIVCIWGVSKKKFFCKSVYRLISIFIAYGTSS